MHRARLSAPAAAGRNTKIADRLRPQVTRRTRRIRRNCRTHFTPSAKAEAGHDENISFEEACKIVGKDAATAAYDEPDYCTRRIPAAITPASAASSLRTREFEFGLHDSKLILADEIPSPDSSRCWPADQYSPGKGQPSNKQFVRRLPRDAHLGQNPARPQTTG